jgi:aminoglycoside phosphotransferase (APT) family kinase protein
VIIDWSDAAIGSPLMDLVTWTSWSEGNAPEREAAVDAWIEAWTPVASATDLRDRLDDILALGAAYQVISYDGILRALEPATRYTLIDGATGFLRRLEEILDQASPGRAT